MNKVTDLLKSALPVAIGVAVGFLIYDQVKAAIAKAKA